MDRFNTLASQRSSYSVDTLTEHDGSGTLLAAFAEVNIDSFASLSFTSPLAPHHPPPFFFAYSSVVS